MKNVLAVFLVLFVILDSCLSEDNVTDAKKDAFTRWKTLRKKLFNGVESVTKRILPRILSASYDANISPECMGSFLKLFNGLRNMKLWAVSMLDASGKVVPGFLGGSLTDLGDYDQCLSLTDFDQTSKRTTFSGQYCTVLLNPPVPPIPRMVSINDRLIDFTVVAAEDEVFSLLSKRMATFYRVPIRSGLCIPSTCSIDDVKEIGKAVLTWLQIDEIDLDVSHCETKSEMEVTNQQIIVLSVFGVIVLLTAVCTLVHVLTRKRNPPPAISRHFRHFSLCYNASKFFGEDQSPASGPRLQVLDGLRWWSMAWICLTHTYGITHLGALGRYINILDMLESYWFGFITSAWVSVDVFFLIGGILVAQATYSELTRRNGRINFFKNIFRRIWRLSPAMLSVLGFMFLLPWFGSGPLWDEVVLKQVRLCQQNWWLAAVYANSWLGHANACLVPTWYVSADLHLYILSPIFVYLFYKNKKVGVTACVVAILASCVAIFVLNIEYDLLPLVMSLTFNEQTTEDVFTTIYFRPYTHVGPYVVGVLLGLFMKTKTKVKVPWYLVLVGWCMSITLAMCVLIGPYRWNQGMFPSAGVAALFQSLHKTAFAMAVAWVIWAAFYGYAGVVTDLLSWPGYKKLSQLVYLIYLTQLPVLWVRVGTFRKTMNFEHFNFFVEFSAVFVISSLISLVIHILVESPFISMDLAMFPKSPKKVHLATNGEKMKEPYPLEDKKHDVECLGIRTLSANGKAEHILQD